MPAKFSWHFLIGLTLAVAAGDILAHSVFRLYDLAWYEGYTGALWLTIAGVSLLAALVWLARRLLTTRARVAIVSSVAGIVLICYFAGVAYVSLHR